ncbi:MAG: substrate-binding domain-containing protein, partial [Burkholderiaceae bacterium]
MWTRRSLVLAGLCAWPLHAPAQQRRSLADPMRLGVDSALHESGFAQALQIGFGRDTGIAVKLVPGPALSVLQALERGELDAVLSNAPLEEARLVALGFAHERAAVASSEFVIVGPLLSPPAPSAVRPKASGRAKPLKP